MGPPVETVPGVFWDEGLCADVHLGLAPVGECRLQDQAEGGDELRCSYTMVSSVPQGALGLGGPC